MSEIKSNHLGAAGGSGIAVKGGEVLTIIHERVQNMSGDPTASKLYGALLNAAGKPYVTMLRQWITSGKLVDPFEELLVKESKFINRGILEVDYTDEYWERRYTVRRSRCTLLRALNFIQLRDGSTLSSKRQTGVPLARGVGGRLPGGACVPPLLEGWKHKILLAGKYLNVIRECGMEVNQNQNYPDDEELLMDDPRRAYIQT